MIGYFFALQNQAKLHHSQLLFALLRWDIPLLRLSVLHQTLLFLAVVNLVLLFRFYLFYGISAITLPVGSYAVA